MKKILQLLLIVIIIIPSTVLASWWNPLSWFSRDQDVSQSRIQALEDKISELESKLSLVNSKSEDVVGAQSDISTVKPPTFIKEDVAKQKRAVTSDATIKSESQTTINKVVTPSVDTQKLFLDVYGRYLSFMKKIDSEIEDNLGSSSITKQMHVAALRKNLETLKDALAGFDRISGLKNKSVSEIDYYAGLLVSVQSEYDTEANRHMRASVIEYFVDNRENISDEDTHIQAARLLDIYDRLYGTQYSKQFKLTRTKVESIEFIDSMLLDLRGK